MCVCVCLGYLGLRDVCYEHRSISLFIGMYAFIQIII